MSNCELFYRQKAKQKISAVIGVIQAIFPPSQHPQRNHILLSREKARVHGHGNDKVPLSESLENVTKISGALTEADVRL
jgi:hypothetical protein